LDNPQLTLINYLACENFSASKIFYCNYNPIITKDWQLLQYSN
jgi:hypothetical protein